MEIIVLRRACRLCDTAREYGVEERALMEINGLERAAFLPAGLSLVLPGEGTAPGGEKELYYIWDKGALYCPGRLSYLAAEHDVNDDGEGDTELPEQAGSRGALSVYVLRARGDRPEMRSLLCRGEEGAAYLEKLTERLQREGCRALGLDIPWLLPFDREQFTAFAARAAEAAHKRGLWFICTLPLHRAEEKYQRRCAAYDVAALGGLADRLIAESAGPLGAAELAAALEYMCALVPGGRLLAGLHEGGLLHRGGEREYISARCAQNIALAAQAAVSRREKGALAEFSYRDPTGVLCRVEYGDALWERDMCTLLEKFSLAGYARRGGWSGGCGTQRVLDKYFAAQELL